MDNAKKDSSVADDHADSSEEEDTEETVAPDPASEGKDTEETVPPNEENNDCVDEHDDQSRDSSAEDNIDEDTEQTNQDTEKIDQDTGKILPPEHNEADVEDDDEDIVAPHHPDINPSLEKEKPNPVFDDQGDHEHPEKKQDTEKIQDSPVSSDEHLPDKNPIFTHNAEEAIEEQLDTNTFDDQGDHEHPEKKQDTEKIQDSPVSSDEHGLDTNPGIKEEVGTDTSSERHNSEKIQDSPVSSDEHLRHKNPIFTHNAAGVEEQVDTDTSSEPHNLGIGIEEKNRVFTKGKQPDTEEQSEDEEEEFHEIVEEYLEEYLSEEEDDSDKHANPSQKHTDSKAEKNVEEPLYLSVGSPHFVRHSRSIRGQSEINTADSPEHVSVDISRLQNIEEIKDEKSETTYVHTTLLQAPKSNGAKLVKMGKKVFARYWLAVVFILLEIGIFAMEQMSAQPPQTPPIIYGYKIASVILSLISFGLAAWDSLMMQRRGERWLFSLTFLGFVFSTLGALVTCLQFWRMQWYNEPLWLKVSPVTFAFAVIVLAYQIWG